MGLDSLLTCNTRSLYRIIHAPLEPLVPAPFRPSDNTQHPSSWAHTLRDPHHNRLSGGLAEPHGVVGLLVRGGGLLSAAFCYFPTFLLLWSRLFVRNIAASHSGKCLLQMLKGKRDYGAIVCC